MSWMMALCFGFCLTGTLATMTGCTGVEDTPTGVDDEGAEEEDTESEEYIEGEEG
jgi:hypothetical protein